MRELTDRLFFGLLSPRALVQVTTASLIQRHVEQLLEQEEASQERSQWLFALAARLERPLQADVCAAYRALLRRCCELRAALPAGPAAQEHLPRLNILIAITGAYFGQHEQLAQLVDCQLA